MTNLNEDVVIEGEVICHSDMVLNGAVLGNIVSSQRVVLGESGKVNGNIHADSAEIHGRVEGDVIFRHCKLGPTAVITGHLKSGLLEMESGASVLGGFHVNRENPLAPPSATLKK